MARLIRVVVEIGDGVSDGYPGNGTMGKGKNGDNDQEEKEIDELVHMGTKDRGSRQFNQRSTAGQLQSNDSSSTQSIAKSAKTFYCVLFT